MQVVYEDNHIIIVSKVSGEIVQGDKTGDEPLSETVKKYLKMKYNKPGNVFLGVVHRLDRPVSGLVTFAKTSKALSRLNDMFRNGDVHKTYWALTRNYPPAEEGTLTHWLRRNEQQNKSYAYDKEVPGSKKAMLKYRVIGHGDNYTLLEVNLLTGRHHQIRCQLAKMLRTIPGHRHTHALGHRHRDHHCVGDAARAGTTFPLRCGQTLDVRVVHRQV